MKESRDNEDILNRTAFEYPTGVDIPARFRNGPVSMWITTSISQLPTSQAYKLMFTAWPGEEASLTKTSAKSETTCAAVNSRCMFRATDFLDAGYWTADGRC